MLKSLKRKAKLVKQVTQVVLTRKPLESYIIHTRNKKNRYKIEGSAENAQDLCMQYIMGFAMARWQVFNPSDSDMKAVDFFADVLMTRIQTQRIAHYPETKYVEVYMPSIQKRMEKLGIIYTDNIEKAWHPVTDGKPNRKFFLVTFQMKGVTHGGYAVQLLYPDNKVEPAVIYPTIEERDQGLKRLFNGERK